MHRLRPGCPLFAREKIIPAQFLSLSIILEKQNLICQTSLWPAVFCGINDVYLICDEIQNESKTLCRAIHSEMVSEKYKCKYRIQSARMRNWDYTWAAWQPRFHDHIIRDEPSLHRISDYIINNPGNWKNDIHHHESL